MSIYNCHKQEPQPWMSYINPNMITYSGKCCPQLVTTTDRLLPFQIISNGVYVKAEISPYGKNTWSEITLTVSSIYTEGFFIHSYHGGVGGELSCGAYDFRVQAGEMWYFEPFKVDDFTITTNSFTTRDLLALPLKFAETELDGIPVIAPCDSILPFMYATENASSGTFTVNLVDVDGGSTELTITVQSLVISGKTYYIHAGTCLYPFLECGKYRLQIVDGANTYYSVLMKVECDLEDIPDGYRAMRDINGCVMRDVNGVILSEACTALPVDVIYGYLYNWYAITRDIAANGWRVPTRDDFLSLMAYLENNTGGKLKDTLYWLPPNTGATNEVLFNARGSGIRRYDTATFMLLERYLYLWSQTQFNSYGTIGYYVQTLQNESTDAESFIAATSEYSLGASVRLIKESTTLSNGESGTYIGNDGRLYDTICIGGQEWLSENLCETQYSNGGLIQEISDNTAWMNDTIGARCSYNNDESNALRYE